MSSTLPLTFYLLFSRSQSLLCSSLSLSLSNFLLFLSSCLHFYVYLPYYLHYLLFSASHNLFFDPFSLSLSLLSPLFLSICLSISSLFISLTSFSSLSLNLSLIYLSLFLLSHSLSSSLHLTLEKFISNQDSEVVSAVN